MVDRIALVFFWLGLVVSLSLEKTAQDLELVFLQVDKELNLFFEQHL